MTLLSGKLVSERILAKTKERIDGAHIVPGLAVVLVSGYIESEKYVALKEARAQEVGVHFEKILFPKTVTHQAMYDVIGDLNKHPNIHGIIVQLPLPDGLPTDEIIGRIDPKKDVDGFHKETLRKFLAGETKACPVFPRAIIELLRETGVRFHGEKAVVVVNSNIIGRVLAFALSLEGLQTEYILSAEGRGVVASETRDARVVVTACGIPDFITADMLASDAIVIDGGNVHVDGKVQGDVKHSEVEGRVAFLSPVPGGVGPVTVATLLARVTDMTLESVDK